MGRLRAAPPRLRAAPSRFPAQPKERADHYGTPAHEAWARAVKERAGWKCEGADHEPGQPRQGVKLYADHVQEITDAPHLALDPTNGQALCASCHGRKTAQARRQRFAS